jgi:CheY-like chemotaxis protein
MSWTAQKSSKQLAPSSSLPLYVAAAAIGGRCIRAIRPDRPHETDAAAETQPPNCYPVVRRPTAALFVGAPWRGSIPRTRAKPDEQVDRMSGATTGDILVIDDDDAIVSFITELLTEEGYAVRGVLSGRDALRAVTERRPALVLLDLRMAGLHGEDVLVYLHSAHRSVPVAIITAEPRLAAPLVERYKIECIAKPFDIDALLDCVRRYVRPRA